MRAPADREIEFAVPFIGRSGQVIDKLLEGLNIPKQDVFLTNIASCRGYDGKVPKEAVRACNPRLQKELEALPLKDLVVLGSPATKVIFGHKAKLTDIRVGPPKVHPSFPGTRVIPTYHTAACLRDPSYFPDVQRDFAKIGTDFVSDWKEPEVNVIEDVGRAVEFLEKTRPDGPIALDIETAYEKDSNYVHPTEQKVICIGVAWQEDVAYVLGKELFTKVVNLTKIMPSLRRFLEGNRLICHNGKFDLGVLRKYGAASLYFDTMLAAYALDERSKSYSLSNLAREELGSPDWKSEVADYTSFLDIPNDILYKYNGFDVINTFRLFQKYEPLLVEDEVAELQHFLCRSSDTLMELEMNGFSVDMSHQDKVHAELDRIASESLWKLRELVGDSKYNPLSWQQVKKALKMRFGKPVHNTTEETIKRVQEQGQTAGDRDLDQFCKEHLRYKQHRKLQSTYIKSIRERMHEGKVHANFQLIRTVTGRLSCTQPNLQNVPRSPVIKNQFVPHDHRNMLVQADYKGAELRTLAYLSRDKYLQEVLSDPDRDLHSEVAARIFGNEFTKEQRTYAKGIVFGVNYGMEKYKLASMIDCTLEEAQRYIEDWYEMIPEVAEYYERLEDDISTWLITQQSPFGHKKRIHFLDYDNFNKTMKESRAFMPQNMASCITLEAMNRVRDYGYGNILRNIIHDALLFEVTDDVEGDLTIRNVVDIMEKAGEEYLDEFVPMPVEISKGKRWGELVTEAGLQQELLEEVREGVSDWR